MQKIYALLIPILLVLLMPAFAQTPGSVYLVKEQSSADKNFSERKWIKTELIVLTDTNMHGRGYVKDGRVNASEHIQRKFKEFKLTPLGQNKSYVQGYAFAMNTFPGKMELKINKTDLVPGEDFLIDASSQSFSGHKLGIKTVDMYTLDSAAWEAIWESFGDTESVYILNNADSACDYWHVRKSRFLSTLPRGCYIIPEKEKLTWTVSLDTIAATVFHVRDSALPEKLKYISVNVESEYIPHERSENIIGCIPGKVKDTFIAFTAHYDHLGMMGENTVFPGASDNASGTAMMLCLENYFSKHPQKYSLLFIAFAGEEAELMGSTFYTMNPAVPLNQIKFLTNIDIMGDATDGITVVNATEFPKQFDNLVAINNSKKYIPDVVPRGPTKNSDHFHFFEKGVPSFFIYSNGGPGFYHDIHDVEEAVSLKNIEGVAKLLEEFTESFGTMTK